MMETEEEEEEEEKDAGIPDSSSTARGLARDDASSLPEGAGSTATLSIDQLCELLLKNTIKKIVAHLLG
jgi:hypothetical protein